MRLFIAVNFDYQTKQNIVAVQDRLREICRGNFTRPENLHLTLVFLGETERRGVAAACRAIENTPVSQMELSFSSVGRFRRNGGDIWWIGLAGSAGLLDMQKELLHNLAPLSGFTLEDRRFSPHITLAREVRLTSKPDEGVLLSPPFSTRAGAVSLMRSERIGGELTYTELYKKEASL